MDLEDVDVGFAPAIADGVPVLADPFELEADGGALVLGGVDRDFQVLGQDGRLVDAFLSDEVEDSDWFAALVALDVFLPRDAEAAVGAEEVILVGREVAEPEFIVVHGEEPRRKVFVVGFALSGDIARAPAAVDELPFAVVDFHGIPGVVGTFRRDRRSWWQ